MPCPSDIDALKSALREAALSMPADPAAIAERIADASDNEVLDVVTSRFMPFRPRFTVIVGCYFTVDVDGLDDALRIAGAYQPRFASIRCERRAK